MASSSSSPHSSSSKSSQPLHNFELPPLLKWHSKDGKSAGTQKRYRTMKSLSQHHHSAAADPPSSSSPPPPPQPEPPLLHLVAAAALFEADLMPPPPPREPTVAVGGEAALDDEFERMSLLREESLRNYRGRDWRSEADQSPVIPYRRNPQKKSASSSSSAAKNRHSSNSAGEADVYRRNYIIKTSIPPSPASSAAGEASRPKSWLKEPAFAAPPAPTVRVLGYFDSENRPRSTNAAAVEAEAYRFPSRKSSFESYSEERRSDVHSFKKSEFASSSAWKKHDWFNKSSPAEEAADAFQKSPFYKKFEFVSKSKLDSPPNSEVKVKIEKQIMEADASNPKSNKSVYASQDYANSDDKSKIEKLSMVVAEAAAASKPKLFQSKKSALPSQAVSDDKSKIEKLSMAVAEAAAASNPDLSHLKKSALPSQAKSDDKMKSKVVEDSHLPPKKKPSFALASPINAESPKIPLLKPKLEQSDAAEKKSNPAKSDAVKIKIEPKEVKQEVENPTKETDLTGDDAEATRVWNLRPRIPKGKGKGKGKAVAQPQVKSGGSAATKSKVEKKEKLSISISLTKEEIEEDIFALTGAKPARRPKKRPRNVQKQLDAVFPGLWLMSISQDTYKVSEKK